MATEEPATVTTAEVSEAQFAFTGSIGAIDGRFAFGPGLQIEWPVKVDENQFAFGAQTGFIYSKNTEKVGGVEATSKSWAIPLLATGKYVFKNSINFFKPFIALGVGLSVDRVTGDAIVGGTSTSIKDTTVHFAMLFRPGATLGSAQHWFLELPIGLMLKEFAVLPSVGYRF